MTSGYEIDGVTLNNCTLVKDLGVLIDSSLSFSIHIDAAVKKAYSALFMIFRNIHTTNETVLKLYKAYVLPHLAYCSQIWSPIRKKDIMRIEKVQQTFSRLLFWRCYRDLSLRAMPGYDERIRILALKTLKFRRIVSDLVFCHSILRRHVNLRANKYWVFAPTSTRIGRFNLHYSKVIRHSSGLFNFIFHRCARWIQRLPLDVLSLQNSVTFKKRIQELDLVEMVSD